MLLFLLKIKFPKNIFMTRGNHECHTINRMYGFYEECVKKYGNANPWKYCVEVFDYLNLAAVSMLT
jgi:serine/threonine-protein phosphatase 6 catalytic subunit